MKRIHAYGLWAMTIGMLAGCQSGGEKFVVRDQRDPAQLGLRVDWIRDFGAEGRLGPEPSNLGRAYAERGELDLRFLRLTNLSRVNRELYPSLRNSGADTAIRLEQVYWGVCPRSSYACEHLLDPPYPEPYALLSRYRAEFDVVGAALVFDSGGVETVPLEAGDYPKSVTLRAGESAILVLRLGLRSGFPVIASEPGPGGTPPGRSFVPPGVAFDPRTRVFRSETLIGVSAEIRPELDLLARNPVTDEMNPVYLDFPSGPVSLFTEGAASIPVAFPPAKVGQEINGLAVQI